MSGAQRSEGLRGVETKVIGVIFIGWEENRKAVAGDKHVKKKDHQLREEGRKRRRL